MRAISLWQPWATAIALGVKNFETRGWSTPFRGMLAIHAAKRWSGEQIEILRASGIETDGLAFGAIVALCRLHDVRPTDEVRGSIEPREEFWGNYDSGRFAWDLQDVRRLEVPVPWKGKQGFFNVPDELLS